jgi:hypothetical protein
MDISVTNNVGWARGGARAAIKAEFERCNKLTSLWKKWFTTTERLRSERVAVWMANDSQVVDGLAVPSPKRLHSQGDKLNALVASALSAITDVYEMTFLISEIICLILKSVHCFLKIRDRIEDLGGDSDIGSIGLSLLNRFKNIHPNYLPLYPH